ncbi:MAG: hypothetical protein J07HB67_00413 [halophilic archaeon J07HB67]|nr:MAG: hypothetical protein J07HB67_00413 [halophilic archaeon J07HB67]
MSCRHLQYRESDGETEFETARAYCTVADRFVQPMRADICNERHGLDPAADCEIYRDDAGLAWDDPPEADPARDGGDP